MLEQSYGLFYFLKSSKNKTIRTVYVRITIDGIPKEASTRRQWDLNRWDQKAAADETLAKRIYAGKE
ncbi:hypothetical protein [Chryseobacterium jejuense]|uniref:Arm DNA-binding domain-containing protein n=1 Tax=Chryseobacterium jejuense TaxID=445960 RepID=A0A2X2VTS0_CHRJE|nr:hypothetical protein [Chryseobacterium jejuense]SDI40018.1 hypothetical protein SAMN05421542_1096 [Chryseobacterium jejuense]SQB26955.1 Uncharacterised protein [Chryseobacterium jejuense]